jgi:hypothetical protein
VQAESLCNAIYDQILYERCNLHWFTSNERAKFVEYGLARRKSGTNQTVFDEPLAILAAIEWADRAARLSPFNCLQRDIQNHSKRQNGFDCYFAFYMQHIFEKGAKLDSVFTFRDDFASRSSKDLAWQHERFELVTVVSTGDRNNPHISVVTPSSGLSSNVGFIAVSGEEVLEWISTNNHRFSFCHPPETFGPGLLFFIRSKKSGKLLLVVVQAKKYEIVEKDALIHEIRTITPAWFWRSKERKVCFESIRRPSDSMDLIA